MGTLLLATSLATGGALKAAYETTLPVHISELMAVYLQPKLNKEWNHRMSGQRVVHTRDHGEAVHQEYRLPWPLKSRELLMVCRHEQFRHAHYATTTCRSIHDEAHPITTDMVRMEILESKWRFEAQPNGRSTKVKLTMKIDEKFAAGVPTFVTKYVQDQALKDSVVQFYKAVRRLKLAPHEQFVGWRRTRAQLRRAAEAAAAAAAASSSDDAAWRFTVRGAVGWLLLAWAAASAWHNTLSCTAHHVPKVARALVRHARRTLSRRRRPLRPTPRGAALSMRRSVSLDHLLLDSSRDEGGEEEEAPAAASDRAYAAPSWAEDEYRQRPRTVVERRRQQKPRQQSDAVDVGGHGPRSRRFELVLSLAASRKGDGAGPTRKGSSPGLTRRSFSANNLVEWS